jgi:hypothetical protein
MQITQGKFSQSQVGLIARRYLIVVYLGWEVWDAV